MKGEPAKSDIAGESTSLEINARQSPVQQHVQDVVQGLLALEDEVRSTTGALPPHWDIVCQAIDTHLKELEDELREDMDTVLKARERVTSCKEKSHAA